MNKIYFKWDDYLETGIHLIDSQHKNLIETINDVLQLCFNNDETNKYAIEKIYNKLSLYISKHFEAEEKLMMDYDVDDRHTDLHFKIHLEFKETIENFFKDMSVFENSNRLGEIAEYLIRWLAYHILSMDKSLVRQIEAITEKGVKANIAYEREQYMIETSTEPLLKALQSLFYIVSEKNKALNEINIRLEEQVRDRTKELLETNEKLKFVSMQDELTGIPNRRYAIIEIKKLLNLWERYDRVFSVLYIDVDKFKMVNDNYGHDKGDEILKCIAAFLKKNLRKTDIACRLGGDEFLVICSECNIDCALNIGNKISRDCKRHELKEKFEYWFPSLSIGVAEIDNNCKTVSDILKKADTAMYLSKENGGGKVVSVQ